ncbi:MAG: hypothetical protein CL991_03440 [Euryarchaeota archaeon]|nr:hypothetical protein [Euryarchaeota archaeon]
MLAFKKAGGSEPNVATAEGVARLQTFLDDVANLELPDAQHQWYQVEVAAMLDGSEILMHEVQPLTGAALLFMNNGVVLAEPCCRGLRQYPRHLLHLFVEDFRGTPSIDADGLLYRVELFSISPADEQLCWLHECREEHDIPAAQTSTARWMRWLNHV